MRLFVLLLALSCYAQLRVSDNHRFLVQQDARPFFWLGDTAWELLHRLNREDTTTYLKRRAEQGFTVIQTVVLSEMDGLSTPNAYGEKPLFDRDPTRPNEKYFEHVDWVIAEAGRHGLTIGLLPTWGNKVLQGTLEKGNDIVFNEANARVYGRWIGNRYKNTKNLVWILGGDRRPEKVVPVWRAMAEGIRETDTGHHLITFHPNGRASSSTHLHNEAWLDFNMVQSGHNRRDLRNDEWISKDYALTPVKPVLDGEPRYENHPVDWKPAENGWFDEIDVRQAAYFALMAGAFGHTYGCHDIWQFLDATREPVGFARGNWRTSINLPGAIQMGYARKLIESRDMLSRRPAPELLQATADPMKPIASRGDRYAMIYAPSGGRVFLNLKSLGTKQVRSSLFDPRTGKFTKSTTIQTQTLISTNLPGKAERGNDWIILLDW